MVYTNKVDLVWILLLLETLFTYQGPEVSIEEPEVNFGLVRLGDIVTRTVTVRNECRVPASWCIREAPSHIETQEDILVTTIINNNNNNAILHWVFHLFYTSILAREWMIVNDCLCQCVIKLDPVTFYMWLTVFFGKWSL